MQVSLGFQQQLNALMKSLQEQFEASETSLKTLKGELQPKLKLMKAATKKPAEPKEEM